MNERKERFIEGFAKTRIWKNEGRATYPTDLTLNQIAVRILAITLKGTRVVPKVVDKLLDILFCWYNLKLAIGKNT
jgi:hypothetical protein